MLASYILLSLPVMAGLVAAVPTLQSRFSTDEVVYISRCVADDGSFTQEEADYYKEINNSQAGQTPDSVSQPQFATSGEPNFNGHHSYFFPSSKVTFTYDAQIDGAKAGQQVGTGSNGKPFTCFRDTDRTLYNRNGQSNRFCDAVIYCRPN